MDWFYVILIFVFLQPWLQRKYQEQNRIRVIRSLEKKRSSRVITLIHRQEAMGFLGFPFFHFINVEDSEQILRAIRMTDNECPIDMILHTPGGLVLASEQIARALKAHKGEVTVFVPHYAMSGGTLLALAADHVVMDPNAVLGPVDPQIGKHPAAALVRLASSKPIEHISDETWIEADIARKALAQLRFVVETLLGERLGEEKAKKIAEKLSQGHFTHDYPITVEEGMQLGLDISVNMPQEVYDLMELHPQSGLGKPSVNFIPTPYKKTNSRD